MEGSDFDIYSESRPKPEEFPTYEPLQPEIPEKAQNIQKKEEKNFWKRYRMVIIAFGVCVLIILGVMLLALIDPKFSEIDLEVSISKGGSTSGDTIYMDTDNIEVRVSNDGSETALGSKITLKISGDNVVDKTITWTGGDLDSNKGRTISISIELENELQSFTLKISVYYDGDYQDKDQIP